ncbi:MAG: thiol-disulfide isomerase [Caulobacteraceae bacterium]|nr:thiol-disulfide isomerase [Caulobacteraceae bacterium]
MPRVLAVLLLSGILATQAFAATPPKAGIASFAELKTPLPYPYDEAADANAEVAKAMARARAHHKLLLIDLGGNWCGDCRVLAGTTELPPIRAFVDKHYEVVTVDVGRFDRNLQVPAHYGFTKRLTGVPTLLVVDPTRDKLLNRDDVFALSSAGSMSPQALADWLARWPK